MAVSTNTKAEKLHETLGLNGWPLWLIGGAGVESDILKALREVQEYAAYPDDFFTVVNLKADLDRPPNPSEAELKIFRDRLKRILVAHATEFTGKKATITRRALQQLIPYHTDP